MRTFADITADYQKMSAQHVAQLKDRFEKLTALRAQVDAELLVLADDITSYGTPDNRRRRSRFEPAECGTESGYQAHRHKGEKCADCTTAHRSHERIASARRKLRKMAGAA